MAALAFVSATLFFIEPDRSYMSSATHLRVVGRTQGDVPEHWNFTTVAGKPCSCDLAS